MQRTRAPVLGSSPQNSTLPLASRTPSGRAKGNCGRFLSNRSMRHEPTGYLLTTYGYDHPREACWSVVETRGAAEKPTPSGLYRREDLARVALTCL